MSSVLGRCGEVPPSHLLTLPTGRRATSTDLVFAFVDISKAVSPGARIYSHQLRHTYATSLLNAGISLTALRDLLGHRSIVMTLRYAAVTQDKLRLDYLKAVEHMKTRYHAPALQPPTHLGQQPNFSQMLLDLVQFLGRIEQPATRRRVRHLVGRIQALQRDLHQVIS